MEKFNELINSQQPVLVDFYATWCGPCKALSPVLEQLKEQYEGQIQVLKVDVDENPDLASKYDIRSVPTMITFKKGEILQTMKGFPGKSKIEDLIKSSL